MIKIDNEFKSLIPSLAENEYQQLEENLLQNGIREPLSIWGEVLIDGHNRYEIAQKHDLEYQTVKYDFESRNDVIFWIIKNQFGRRNLSSYDRSLLALKLKPVIAERAKENMIATQNNITAKQKSAEQISPIETRKELAKMADVSHDTINKVERIEEKAIESIKQMAKNGNISINQPEQAARQTTNIQEMILPKINNGVSVDRAVKEIQNEIKMQERKKEIQKQKEIIVKLPEGKFNCIVN